MLSEDGSTKQIINAYGGLLSAENAGLATALTPCERSFVTKYDRCQPRYFDRFIQK